MYGMDQTLPAWTAALDPVDLLWNDSSSVCEPSQQEAASVVCFPSASQSSARPVPNSTQPGIQAQSGAAASTQQHQMWEPVPFAPDDFRAEVFNLLTAPALTTARPQPGSSPLSRNTVSPHRPHLASSTALKTANSEICLRCLEHEVKRTLQSRSRLMLGSLRSASECVRRCLSSLLVWQCFLPIWAEA